ncbi:MAG TPA: cytochrome c oxidase assembly protein [Devosia sp.]|nr:cytochrome c oxidase assembly protein [Devosia sp.]
MAQDTLPRLPTRNRNVGLMLLLLAVAMVGAAYAAVPLYYAFCAATGYGGTTRVATEAPKGVIAREMTVAFDADTDAAMPWAFVAAKPITDKIGGVDTAVFTARNLSNHAVTGQAVYNVTPELAGQYFNKVQCFCFNKQTLQPGESVEMPVTFFVDPAIDKDPDLKTVKTITLHYTFYAAKE